MPDFPPSLDDLPILRELGDDLKAAFRTASAGKRRTTSPPRMASARRRVRVSLSGLVAAFSVIVALGVAVLAIALLGHSRMAAHSRAAQQRGASSVHPTRSSAPPADAIMFDKATSDSLDARIEIAYVPAAGGAVVSLTAAGKDGMVASEPRWSPNGSRIAFVMSPQGHLTRYAGDGDIYVMHADGTHIRRLTAGLNAASPAWSPNGSRIAFVENQGQQLVVMNADGSDQRVIARARGAYQAPTWSPNGQAIAYQSSPDQNIDVRPIYTIRPDGTGQRQLTPRSASAGSPAWSPDGSRIAYSAGKRLWVMSSNGANAHPVTQCRLSCVYDSAPAWSPTGSDLVFVRQEDRGAATHLYVLKLSTGTVRPVAPNVRWAGSPDWRRQAP